MGFLRKLGRKLKKGVKKLFSTKLGALVGSIAIGMILGPVIGNAWKGIKGAFGVGQGATTAATTATTGAAATTGTEAIIANLNIPTTIPQSSTLLTTEGLNTAAIEKAFSATPISSGASFNVSNTVTGAINNTAANAGIPGFNTKAFERAMASTNVPTQLSTEIANLSSTISPKTVADVKQPFFGEGGKLREYGSSVKKDFKEGFSVGDVASGVVTGYATTSLLSGDQTDEGGYGRMPDVSSSEAAQASYIQDISSSYNAAMGTTGLPNFLTMSQQTLYGNGSPQSFYQPLLLPNIG